MKRDFRKNGRNGKEKRRWRDRERRRENEREKENGRNDGKKRRQNVGVKTKKEKNEKTSIGQGHIGQGRKSRGRVDLAPGVDTAGRGAGAEAVKGMCTKYAYKCVYEICVRNVCTKYVYEICVRNVCTKYVYEICVRNMCTKYVYKCVYEICVQMCFKMTIIGEFFFQICSSSSYHHIRLTSVTPKHTRYFRHPR